MARPGEREHAVAQPGPGGTPGDIPDSYAEGYRFQVEPTGEARTSGTAAALAGLQGARVEGDPVDVDRAVQRLLLLHAVVFAMQGMPLLYSGDEIGQCNDFSYLDDPLTADDNRWIHRRPMNWAAAENRDEEGTVEQRLFDGITTLSRTRKDLDALDHRADERVHDTPSDKVFAVERVRGDDRLLCVANLSGDPQAVDVSALPDVWNGGGYTELLREERAVFPDGRIVLEPYGVRWLEPAPDVSAGETLATEIRFELDTDWGEELYLTGSIDALGNWDVDDAVPLSADAYPTWHAEVDVPRGTYFEFEWLILSDKIS